MVQILGVSGSLRKNSYNSALLHATTSLSSKDVNITVAEPLDNLPFFTPDMCDEHFPSALISWKASIKRADAIIIASPEYAHAISGVLKNALDWVVGSGELIDKPIAVWNASPTHIGASRAHEALKYTVSLLSANLVNDASFSFSSINQKIDSSGNIVDKVTLINIIHTIEELKKIVIQSSKQIPNQ